MSRPTIEAGLSRRIEAPVASHAPARAVIRTMTAILGSARITVGQLRHVEGEAGGTPRRS